MQVGTTKDQGLYNKPSAAVHPRALATGALPQYNTIQYVCVCVCVCVVSPSLFATILLPCSQPFVPFSSFD